jgi:LacI family transcriptional regulator
VARLANVSSAVVSYVINGGPRRVAPGTRDRVLAAIEQLGYRANGAARQLASGRSQTLGLIVPRLGSSYLSEVTQQLSRDSFARGYELLIGTSEDSLDTERSHLISFAERRVDAVILLSVLPTAEHLAWARSLGLTVLTIDRPEMAERRTRAATEHILTHGHTRVALITGPEGIASTRRESSWTDTLREHGVDVRAEYIARRSSDVVGGRSAAAEFLSLAEPPTAIVTQHDLQALGALRASHDFGLAVPSDLAIMSTEGSAFMAYTVPSLSSVSAPEGVFAHELLDAALAGEAGRVANVDFEVNARESCGCPG